jgi:hypothetical protein
MSTVWTEKILHFTFTLNINKAHRVFQRGLVTEERGNIGKKQKRSSQKLEVDMKFPFAVFCIFSEV